MQNTKKSMTENNAKLNSARAAKNDEFYTQYKDIEEEIQHYLTEIEGKRVYCQCDDYRMSNFVKYFKDNFDKLKLAHLTATNYDIGEGAWRYDYNGSEEKITALESNGDFRTDECAKILNEIDVVITNPPFSLFREYILYLINHKKKFLIVGSGNAITFKEVFPLLQNNIIWPGYKSFSNGMKFIAGKNYDNTKCKYPKYDEYGNVIVSVMMCGWFTNMKNGKSNQHIKLTKKYNPEDYPTYENYDAIECKKLSDIPYDYDGIIGVPITVFDKISPDQFEIIGRSHGYAGQELGLRPYEKKWKKINKNLRNGDVYYIKDNKPILPYFRIMIRRKK